MRRIIKGILATSLGMNAIAFGMKLNGSNRLGNLAWDIVSTYLTLQLWTIVLAIFIITLFAITKFDYVNTEDVKTTNKTSEIQLACQVKTSNIASEKLQKPKEIPKEIVRKKLEAPKKLNKEDLKKRVLQELTGRSDI